MANTYPYISSIGGLVKAVEQFRRSFPNAVDAAYLKRMKIAPGNESYLINILRFIGLIDDEGVKVEEAANAFFGNEDHFRAGLSEIVSRAYAPVFEELGPDAWTASRDDLAHWFRMVDKTTELIGQRQASTFLALAGLTGRGTPFDAKPTPKSSTRAAKPKATRDSSAADATSSRKAVSHGGTSNTEKEHANRSDGPIGLSVRIEINVPVGATADEYDAMFASIRKHLYPA
ncbi:hypothetical protein B5M43_006705 [Microbacterium sp. MEC084]|uniref:DUF5343 domain-containing protein n=1 Tax=Microbacterium sp. MEC084 TaxID=1963027 RepID=UPI0010700F9C|nr:DUF5343 domain-containing protein [Microbacterium sp. MEC084]MCD1268544.1 hypothetical protein [Microbacterium sp. MEC084]